MTSKKVEATFDTINWDEKDTENLAGSTIRLTRTRTEREFKGDISGKALVEYNFAYHPVDPPADPSEDKHKQHGPVTYNGIMYFKGTIKDVGNGGEGEIVFDITGTWGKDGVQKAVGEWKAISGTGKGAFKDLKGAGGYESGGMKDTPCWLNVE